MSAFRHLWTHHRLALLAFLAAALISLLFLVRLTVFTLYWADPAHRNQLAQPWMTPGYLAHSWQLDPTELAQALGIPPGSRPTLQDIARDRGVPVEDILREINALLAESPRE
jgi:hypothetical protein